MTIKERILNEKDNLNRIILYNDRGLFFNLVERSAYAFNTRIRPFKVHVKTLKSLDNPYVCIGIPVQKIKDYLDGLDVSKDDNGNITAILPQSIDENAFQAWKKHIVESKYKEELSALSHQETAVMESMTDNEVARQCLLELKSLNIASMTPMDTMLYLNSIQQKLKDIDI